MISLYLHNKTLTEIWIAHFNDTQCFSKNDKWQRQLWHNRLLFLYCFSKISKTYQNYFLLHQWSKGDNSNSQFIEDAYQELSFTNEYYDALYAKMEN